MNPVAELNRPDSGDIVKPAQTKQGDKLFCPDHDCGDPDRKLFLKHSSLGNPFFSHRPGFSHPIYPQTLLHKLSVKWFEGQTALEIPEGRVVDKILTRKTLNIDPTKTQLEFRQHQSVIPDVIVETEEGFKIAIEIVVSNDVSPEKSILLHELKLPTICIDLSDFYNANKEACRTDIDFIKSNLDRLLQDLVRKRWVRLPPTEMQNPGIEWKQKQPASTDGCLLSFVALIVIYFVVSWILY